MWWSKLCGCLALIKVLAGCRAVLFIRGPKEEEVSQWETLQSWFITDVDKSNLLPEYWDTIFNENLTIINMLLLNILGESMGSDYSRLSSKFSIILVSAVAKESSYTLTVFSADGFNMLICTSVFIVLTFNTQNTRFHGDAPIPIRRTFTCNRKYSFLGLWGLQKIKS